ncbi:MULTISPECIES: hypothetical protein [Brevibacterium]|nr:MULTISPECIES: hypothetical protein [Brevibacterium]
MAMWNWADDSGHGTANLKELEAFVFPNDDVAELPRMSARNSAGSARTWQSFAEVCGEVAEAYGVVFYKVKNRPYYWITNFKDHQSKHFRLESRYPRVDKGQIYDVTSGNVIPQEDAGAQLALVPEESARNSADFGPSAALVTGEEGNRVIGDMDASLNEEEAPKGRKRPATQLPDDWTPSQDHCDKAVQLGLDIDEQVERFRNHAAANDRRQASWNASFSNWLLQSSKYQNESNRQTGDPNAHLWR